MVVDIVSMAVSRGGANRANFLRVAAEGIVVVVIHDMIPEVDSFDFNSKMDCS